MEANLPTGATPDHFIAAAGAMQSDSVQAILAARARKLAQPLAAPEAREECRRVLVMAVAGERFAIDSSAAIEVQTGGHIVAIPGVASMWLGLVNLRGRLYPVLDLGRLLAQLHLHAPPAGMRGTGQLVLATGAGLTLALHVDSVETVRQLARSALLPSVSGHPEMEGSPVIGMTDDLVVLLDVDVLFRNAAPAGQPEAA